MAGWEEGCLSLQEVTGGPSCLMMSYDDGEDDDGDGDVDDGEDDDGEYDGRLTLPHKR